jgi:hypothetical protein
MYNKCKNATKTEDERKKETCYGMSGNEYQPVEDKKQ